MSEISVDFDLGPIDQVSFAIEDMDAAVPFYSAMFGPITTRRVEFEPDAVSYRGKPASAKLLLGFARSGDIEIELVQVEEGEAPSLEHLRRHGEGLHHVRFRVHDIAAKKAQLEAAGFETILDGTTPRGSRFVYIEAPAMYGHTVFELLQR